MSSYATGTDGVSLIDIDPTSPTVNRVIGIVPTGGGNDEMDYDWVDMKLYVANRNNGFVAVIDATNDGLVGTIKGLGPALEQPRYNSGDGMVYQVSNGDKTIYQIDPQTDQLVQQWDIGFRCTPNGLAINPTTGQALLGCRRSPNTVIWHLARGEIVSVIDQVGDGDMALYDPVADRFFFATRAHPDGPAIGIFSGTPAAFLTKVPSTVLSGNVVFDQTHRLVYTSEVRDGKPGLLSFPLPR